MKKFVLNYFWIVVLAAVLLALTGNVLATLLCAALVAVAVTSASLLVAAMGGLVSFVVMYFLYSNVVISLLLVVEFFALGFAVGFCLRKKQGIYVTLAAGSLCQLLARFGIYYYLGRLSEKTIIAYLSEPVVGQMKQLTESYMGQAATVFTGEQLEVVKAMFGQMESFVQFIAQNFIPAILIILSMVLSYLTLALTRGILHKFNFNTDNLRRFYQLHCYWPVSVALLLFVLGAIFTGGTIQVICMNVAVILLFILFACGISVVDSWLIQAKLRRWLRIVIVLAAFFLLSLMSAFLPFLHPVILFAILGMIDSCFPIRKR